MQHETTTRRSHYLIIDSDDGTVLAWFPKTDPDAEQDAQRLATDTAHTLTEGHWDALTGWEIDGTAADDTRYEETSR